MSYDFSKLHNRKGTGCLKYDFAIERGKPADVLPFWVADMDFVVPQEVINALVTRSKEGIFGYSETGHEYFLTLQKWFQEKSSWVVQEDWLVKTPGVVFALATAVQAFTEPGDAIIIQQPVYYPFSEVIEKNGRRLINSPLINNGLNYKIDFQDFEQKIITEKVKLFILCNPHNPVGRVWSVDELRTLGDICLRHDVLVVSDEIHADFIWENNKHTVFASLGDSYAENSLVCTSPSKSFNLAGLQVSNIFIPNKILREKFKKNVVQVGYSQLNVLGLVACEAAYKFGSQWLAEVKEYIYQNIIFTEKFLQREIPLVKFQRPQGTYLLWLDFSAFGVSTKQREKWLLEDAKLWLDSGRIFGKEGNNFERINVACPRIFLEKGLKQLAQAIPKLK